MRHKTYSWAAGITLAAAALLLGSSGCRPEVADSPSDEPESLVFSDVEAQTRQFIDYHESMTLTAEQERIKDEALSAIPAPCCSDRTAATCCCQCNSSRSIWGLSGYLIAELGYDAPAVREVVTDWIDFTHPSGFAGDACYNGGCSRSFEQDGCGGMRADRIIF